MITKRCIILLGILALVGCGGADDNLYHVSGTATYDGKPIPAGIIYLDPESGTGGTQGFTNIKDGKFTTAVDGKGIRGGAYRLRVSGYNGKPANEAPLGQPLWVPEYELKKEFPKQDSELRIEVPKK